MAENQQLQPEDKQGGGKDYVPRTKYNEKNEALKSTSDALKSAQEKLAKIEADNEASRLKKLEKDGELKKLLEEKEKVISSLEPKVEEWNQYRQNKKESLLSKIPEEKREAFKDASISILENVVEMQKGVVDIKDDKTPGREKGTFKNLADVADAYAEGNITLDEYRKASVKFKKKGGYYG